METTGDATMAPPSTAKLVIKRDGTKEDFSRAKLEKRLEEFSYGLDKEFVTFKDVLDKVEAGIYEGKFTFDSFQDLMFDYRSHLKTDR